MALAGGIQRYPAVPTYGVCSCTLLLYLHQLAKALHTPGIGPENAALISNLHGLATYQIKQNKLFYLTKSLVLAHLRRQVATAIKAI